MKEKWCYSWDGEDYSSGLFNTEKEAIDEARKKDSLGEVWIAKASKLELKWNFAEDEILMFMEENLEDECGEYGECALDHVTEEQAKDLANMIDEAIQAWVKKHKIEPQCYSVYDSYLYRFYEEAEVDL